jgi:hypothetical protein
MLRLGLQVEIALNKSKMRYKEMVAAHQKKQQQVNNIWSRIFILLALVDPVPSYSRDPPPISGIWGSVHSCRIWTIRTGGVFCHYQMLDLEVTFFKVVPNLCRWIEQLTTFKFLTTAIDLP